MIGSAAFWFSLLTVAYWAFWNFHRPHHPDVIRFAVTRRRYALGVMLHVAAALVIFLLAVLAARFGLRLFPGDLPAEARTGLPLSAALIVTILLPRMPWIGPWAEETRRLIQSLALFPAASAGLTVALAKGGNAADEEARKDLRAELAVFALPPGAFDRAFPPGVLQVLEETHTLRLRLFTALEKQGPLDRFVTARGAALEEARLEHLRLLRRVARTTLLVESLRCAPPPPYADEEDERPDIDSLGQFLREESQAVAMRFHRLAADAALSVFHGAEERTAFLRHLGYNPHAQEVGLPFASIVAVAAFAAVAPAVGLLFLLQPLMHSVVAAFGVEVTAAPPSPRPRLLMAAAFCVLQLIIVLCAVMPKAMTRWAWPQAHSLSGGVIRRAWQRVLALPLGSYALAAAGALLAQALVAVLLLGSGVLPLQSPFGIPSFQIMLITSAFGVVCTIGLSLLIDCRLLDRQFRFDRGRLLDGVMLGVTMAAADAFVVQPLIVAAGGTLPGLGPTVMMGLLGLVLGALVPASVAAWLNHRMAETARQEGNGAGKTSITVSRVG